MGNRKGYKASPYTGHQTAIDPHTAAGLPVWRDRGRNNRYKEPSLQILTPATDPAHHSSQKYSTSHVFHWCGNCDRQVRRASRAERDLTSSDSSCSAPVISLVIACQVIREQAEW